MINDDRYEFSIPRHVSEIHASSMPMKRWLQNIYILLLSFWLVTLIMVPKDPLKVLPGRDSGVFLYGGQQVLAGSTPYVDFWDHKGPMIYYINALGLWMGAGSRWGVWFLEYLCLMMVCLGIYWLADRYQGGLAGIASMCFGAFLLSRIGPYQLDTTNYMETYSIFFNILAVILWISTLDHRRNYWFLMITGAMLGVSFCFRPNNIGTAIAIGFVEIQLASKLGRLRSGLRHLFVMMTGALAILAIVFSVLLVQGAFLAYIDQVYVFNFQYTQFGSTGPFQILSQGITGWIWLPVLSYSVVMATMLRKVIKEKNNEADHVFYIFLLIGLPIEIVLTLLARRVYTHYFILWVPYLAGLIGIGFQVIPAAIKQKLNRIPPNLISAIILAGLIVINSQIILTIARQLNRLINNRSVSHIEVINPIVDYVVVNTEPGQEVLVWGNDVWINFLADRKSSTRYLYQSPLFMPGYTNGGRVLEFLEDIRDHPPTLIVSTQKIDYRDMYSLETLLELRGDILRIGLPVEFEAVIGYITSNYYLKDTVRAAIIYEIIPK